MAIQKVLIANRGEIACRIARTCKARGIGVVGVHSEADIGSRHVRVIGQSTLIGAAPSEKSYLNIDRIIKAAKDAHADAIHPGFGFLAESPEFSRRVEAEGLIFIGPTASTLEQLGDKGAAKALARSLKIPTIPGSETAFDDVEKIAGEASEIGLPVLLKAVAGGGGRGQRIVRDIGSIAEEAEAAMREAKAGFGDSAVIVEKLIENPRHIEIQIAGDGAGHVVHLFERDCSLQRRRQKVIEEAPAPNLAREFLDEIAQSAVGLAKALDFRGVGTVEFLVLGDEYWFLEVNPRIQVEHPVTEEVTGIDIVELQLRISSDQGLGITQSDIHLTGHAFEARIYAEDPGQNFTPSTGRIDHIILPGDARIEAGVGDGDMISPHYDPMIAKVIVHKAERNHAIKALQEALQLVSVAGVTTNIDFLRKIMAQDDVWLGNISTEFIDRSIDDLIEAERPPLELVAAAAAIWTLNGRTSEHKNIWMREQFTGWRLGTGQFEPAPVPSLRLSYGTDDLAVRISGKSEDGRFVVVVDDDRAEIALKSLGGDEWMIVHGEQEFRVSARVGEGDITLLSPIGSAIFMIASEMDFMAGDVVADGHLRSPLMGQIVKIVAEEGTLLQVGDTVAVLESMKMEIPIKATRDGTLVKLNCAEGDTVERGQLLAELE